jgi:hypothetical protein
MLSCLNGSVFAVFEVSRVLHEAELLSTKSDARWQSINWRTVHFMLLNHQCLVIVGLVGEE